jgi:hypothetical protein
MERASLDTREVQEAPLSVAEVGVWPARAPTVFQVLKVVGTANLHLFQQTALFSVGEAVALLPRALVDSQSMVAVGGQVLVLQLVELPCLQEMVVIIRLQLSD